MCNYHAELVVALESFRECAPLTWCGFTNWFLLLLTCWYCHVLAFCDSRYAWRRYVVRLLWDSRIWSPTSLPIVWCTIQSPWCFWYDPDNNFFSPPSKIWSVCQSVFSVLGHMVVLEPTTMVGSTSFSSRVRISVITSFADQSFVASCLGCQQNRFWNGWYQGGFTHHGQDRSFDFAHGIPTSYSRTVRSSTIQWPLFTFHNFEHWYLQYQYFLWNRSASYCA